MEPKKLPMARAHLESPIAKRARELGMPGGIPLIKEKDVRLAERRVFLEDLPYRMKLELTHDKELLGHVAERLGMDKAEVNRLNANNVIEVANIENRAQTLVNLVGPHISDPAKLREYQDALNLMTNINRGVIPGRLKRIKAAIAIREAHNSLEAKDKELWSFVKKIDFKLGV